MSILRGLFLMTIAASTIASGSVAAQGRGRGSSQQQPKKAAPAARVKYTDQDRDSDARVISVWYREHPSERVDGRGRARGHAIAPGYEKKLVRSAIVPVEYRVYFSPAPVMLVRTLPPVRSGWEFVVIENRVYLIDRPTWRIVDVVAVF